MNRLLRRLGSVRLCVGLLLVLALAAALATVLPQNLDRAAFLQRFPRAGPWLVALGFPRFFASPLYRGLLVLLTLNLLTCALGRSVEGWRAFRGRGTARIRVDGPPDPGMADRLRAAGFRIRSASPLRASRRPWAFLGFPLTHLSLPVIFGGALLGSLAGFVATQTVYVGDETRTAFDWRLEKERALPFRLRVDGFRQQYYPIALKVRLGPRNGPTREVVTREGGRVQVPGIDLTVRIGRFDPETGNLTFWVESPRGTLGPFSRENRDDGPVSLTPLGFRDPQLRRVEARVRVLGPGGETVRQAVIAVNEPLVHAGVRVYLTAWGTDPYGFGWVGFQITRDPGQPLVWTGSACFVLGLGLLALGGGAWVREERGVVLAGATGGRQALRALLLPPPPPRERAAS
ncbi:cytochrome c biogenesis protein ResB [Deferrisoma camini]|uniref:cytochrome c biogenesis protein ResB n=1 Tax=Deferrisoma camini TaxID=1035120 RepID=UPI00046CA892|nr:cytochrome c biogenesis protein ResB [Deferrisoma camini]